VLRPTGERVIPAEQREELVYAEHLARYQLAAQFAAGRRVLDAGCGEGFGTAVLQSAGASTVVGVDIDRASVKHASQRYGLDFVEADLGALPYEEESFDLVTCFETIEHVADGSRALSELRRVLAVDGLLLVSTPNVTEYLVENEFHEREYEPAEFDLLLAEHFPERHWLYQQNWLLSAILDERQMRADSADSVLEVDLAKAVGIEPGRQLYSVVVCGPIERAPRQVAVASGIYEANLLAAEVAKAQRERKAWQERATLAERQREGWEERATTAESQREAWEKRATTAERQREAWEERADEAERQVEEARRWLAEAEQALDELVASWSWRITRPLRWMRAHLVPRR
jgi:2-polyprenyl-3-methyl-5-hydroxy-6-metoxy-1,4-benzoquinol methylase